MKLFELLKSKQNFSLIFIFFAALLIFTRLYNLNHTARFTRDESSDLLHMETIFRQRKLTLVGPISSDNVKVFGSLTYYMLLPFTAATNFDPIGPVYGTAFWGILTVLLLLAITWKLNHRYLWLTALLCLIWYPLVETSRWAWNPHYVTFWIALGIVAYLIKTKLSYFLAGIFLALSFHNHYIALFGTGTFVVVASYLAWRKKQWQHIFWLLTGYILPFIPFVLFDLRHPPGLFFSQYLASGNTPHLANLTLLSFVQRLWDSFWIMVNYIALPTLGWLVGSLLVWLAWLDRKKIEHWLWLLPVIAQLLVGTILSDFQTRYFLPALVFLFVWLIVKRQGLAGWLAKALLWLMIISSLFTVIPQLTQTKVPPDIYSLRSASQLIANKIKDDGLNNANVAVLASKDSGVLGEKYRDYISMLGVGLKAASEYDTSENLFVISTADEQTVKTDPSAAMQLFKGNRLDGTYTIPNSNWKVYWFHY